MNSYKHTVQYYETDRMGITHHSNYIRWMEEARVDYLRQIGWGYEKLEQAGISSPVTAIDCKYRVVTTFPEEITIQVTVSEYNGIVLKLNYVMMKQNGQTVFEGHSEHCFMNKEGKIVRLAQSCPAFHSVLSALLAAKQ